MTFIHSLTNKVERGFQGTTKSIKNAFDQGIHNLKNKSFKEALIQADSRNRAIRKAVGVKEMTKDGQYTTQLEQLEIVSGKVEKGTEQLANIPGIRHIPILGSVLEELHSGAGEIRYATSKINQTIDEQDEASKQGRSNINHYAKIGKTGIQTTNKLKKNFEKYEVQPVTDPSNTQTNSRYNESLTI